MFNFIALGIILILPIAIIVIIDFLTRENKK